MGGGGGGHGDASVSHTYTFSKIGIRLRVKLCKGMPPKAFEVGALRAKNLILWLSPYHADSCSAPSTLIQPLPSILQFNFSSHSLNSNKSKPLQIK